MPQFFYKVVSSPLGWIRIVTSEKHLIRIDFPSRNAKSSKRAPEILKKTEKQIREYFSGMGEKFALAIPFANLEGTSFQRRVWKAMSKIPYAKTVSYKELAKMAGSSNAYRAVGSACGKNPLPIVIPCHRVLASSGLGGFTSGLWRKKWLLKHEANSLSS